ncbi:MAG: hypothetical protein R3F11_13090 [Verrucomicrobiales bacterium]
MQETQSLRPPCFDPPFAPRFVLTGIALTADDPGLLQQWRGPAGDGTWAAAPPVAKRCPTASWSGSGGRRSGAATRGDGGGRQRLHHG